MFLVTRQVRPCDIDSTRTPEDYDITSANIEMVVDDA